VYLVTDPGMPGAGGVCGTVGEALEAGIGAVQLRDKTASTRSLIDTARILRGLCEAHGALFLVNDRVDVALASAAHGVHLGQDDLPASEARRLMGPGAVIGVSVRTAAEAREAEEAGADYLAANLVFATGTKTDIEGPLGLEGVAMLRAATGLPLVAIGGIGPDNAADVIGAGADGIAVVSAIMAAPDVTLACRRLFDGVYEALSGKGI
jgi:thiamine-phosphate pyrophosphorylase